MKILLYLILLWIVFCPRALAFAEEKEPPKPSSSKPTVGYMEKVRLYPQQGLMLAYLKPSISGALLHAEEIRKFKRKGKKWVRFTITDIFGKKLVLEREIVRVARIKQEKGASIKRIVVELGICIGDIYVEGEVKLADRAKREQRMVIGRDILAGTVLIDPSLSHAVEPNCKNIPEDKLE